MKKSATIILLSLFVMCCSSAMAGGTGHKYLYRLTLKDKRGTPFSIGKPQAYLSQKAIERRRRQHLDIDSTDLPITPSYIKSIEATGAEVIVKSKWNNTVLVGIDRASQYKDIQDLPFVASAKKVYTEPEEKKDNDVRDRYHTILNQLDTVYDNNYGVAREQIEMVGGLGLHRRGYTGKGMTIAVFDAGFMNADRIPALTKIKIEGTHDFLSKDKEDMYRGESHGTMTLSVIAVHEPGLFKGTAPDATFWLFRCEDDATETSAEEDYWTAAAEFADSVGVDVISSSLGYHDFDDKTTSYHYYDQNGHTSLISRTSSMLAGKGIIHVNSAGNDGMGTWKKINFPSDAEDMLSVGAVTPQGVNASFSSLGPTADGRVKPDVVALGSPTAVVSGRGTLTSETGTSFSTPVISGMVACLWQALPDKTAREIIELVRQSGNNYEHPDNVYGYGLPDFTKALKQGKHETDAIAP